MPDIFHYTSYREFLKDYYRERKAANRAFSYQGFARKAGIASSGFLLHVMKGERNLTRPVLLKVARAMDLDGPRTEYFGDLVCLDQAKTPAEKDFYSGKVMAGRQSAHVKTLDDRQFEFYSEWYHSLVRELVPLLKRGSPPSALARMAVPALTAGQAKRSLKLMEELGILKRVAGGYAQSDPFIGGSGSPVRKAAITRFQKSMLGVAAQAWDRFPENEISMHTATFTLSGAALPAVVAELQAFKNRLLKLVREDRKAADRVYHLNLNFFPMSRKAGEDRP